MSADICIPFVFPTAHISLDPRTSHPKLLLSEDYQQARFSYKWQKSPDNPQRFDRATCVLAHGGFTGGRHTWVVSVDLAHGGSCTLGVVSKDIRRKGELRMRPEEGVWAVPGPEQCPLSVPGKEGRPGRSQGPLGRDFSCPGLSSTPSRERPLAAGGAAPGPHTPQVSAAWPKGGRGQEQEEASSPRGRWESSTAGRGQQEETPGRQLNPPQGPHASPGLDQTYRPWVSSPEVAEEPVRSWHEYNRPVSDLSRTRVCGEGPWDYTSLWC